MEPEINQTESRFAPLQKVTPLSKYLAMALFIILPFVGGWIGYTYAPEKLVEVERVVILESQAPSTVSQDIPSVEVEIADNVYNQESLGSSWQSGCDGDIEKHFLVNEENVYYDNKIVVGADAKTFMIIPTPPAPCEEVYARDKEQVFYKDTAITGANPDEFKIYDSLWNTWRIMGPYSHDENNVYYENKLIDGADIKSFTAFYEKGYASDKKAVYLDGVIVEGAEPSTFDFPISEGA